MKNYKSINALMKHMRSKKTGSIAIYGSRHKKLLQWDGYYHGYKGYRFYRNSSKCINYKNYDEVHAVIEYDMALKSAFYRQIMFLETALKNLALEVIIKEAGTNRFNEIYSKLIHDPKRKELNNQLRQRDNIYSTLTRAYDHSPMVQHFYNKDDYVPIWAIFEIISLGDFGNLISSLCPRCRKELSERLGLRQSCDTDHRLFHKIVLTLKDLRNAVAHNSVVYDCRFNNSNKSSKTGKVVANCLEIETGLTNITLHSIYDYAALIVYLLKLLDVPKTIIRSFIREIESCKNEFEKSVDRTISAQVIPSSTRKTLAKLYSF